MTDESNSLDSQILTLDARLDRQLRWLSKPAIPESKTKPTDPLYYVRLFVGLMALAAGFRAVYDVAQLFFPAKESVWVSTEGAEIRVWRDLKDFESKTGKHWIEQPPGVIALASYESVSWSERLLACVQDIVWLGILTMVLKKLREVGQQAMFATPSISLKSATKIA